MLNLRNWCAERVRLALCGIECVNLNSDVIKMLEYITFMITNLKMKRTSSILF